MEKHLHIISFNVPYPPDYGGIIDVFYRIKNLHELGVKIHLHTYQYNRPESNELQKYCDTIHYYPRKRRLLDQFSLRPNMIVSRNSNDLLQNLLTDNFPILFEGLHTTFHLTNIALKDRLKLIRAHNIEHEHYYNHSFSEKNIFKKCYFILEALRLKWYEKVINKAQYILPISKTDHVYFSYLHAKSLYIPSFHPFNNVVGNEGTGEYILYHGNLALAENSEVVISLIKNVISKVNYPFIVAGKCPPSGLEKICKLYPNIKLIANPDEETMNKLINEAHIHLLHVERSSGLRLKLLYSLYAGRHCVVNDAIIYGTNLDACCEITNTAEETIQKINTLMQIPFTKQQKEIRQRHLSEHYDNKTNAKKIIELLG